MLQFLQIKNLGGFMLSFIIGSIHLLIVNLVVVIRKGAIKGFFPLFLWINFGLIFRHVRAWEKFNIWNFSINKGSFRNTSESSKWSFYAIFLCWKEGSWYIWAEIYGMSGSYSSLDTCSHSIICLNIYLIPYVCN